MRKLNLVLVDTTKCVTEVADFFSLPGSYVHNKWKIMQHEMSPGLSPIEIALQRLSDTRWACRYYSVHAALKHLPVILKVLDEINDEPNSGRSLDACALKGLSISCDAFFILCYSWSSQICIRHITVTKC